MDIRTGCGYPGSALSNFTPHAFVFDALECASMEGLLQSLKFNKPHIKAEVCKLLGTAAKLRVRDLNNVWQRVQTLWWKGLGMKRRGAEYQQFLGQVFQAMFEQCEPFRKALMTTHNAVITHSNGKNKEADTVLTEREFCSRLMKLRNQYTKQCPPRSIRY